MSDSVGSAGNMIKTPGRGLFKSRLLRLLVGIAVVGIVLAVLALGVMRLLGPSQKFATIELPYVEEFGELDPRQWFLGDGVWALRDEMLAQNANLNKSAEIYLPGKLASEQPYHLSTYVTLGKSTQQAGVNFNAQYPDMTKRQHQVYLARRPADLTAEASGAVTSTEALPIELVAGYTGEEGAFVKQVSIPFGPDTNEYRLDVYVLGNTYTVQVNGQTLIDRRPLFYNNGLVGYHTLGPARFDTLKITTAATGEPGEQVYVSDFDQTPGGAGWVPFAGEWEIAEGVLVQANPAAQDAAIGYEGSAFEEYGLQAAFRHLTGSGGGLLFNMPSAYQVNGAHLVRYSDQTDSIFWGYFDAQGVFTRQGFANVAPPGTDLHRLRVLVGGDSYDVYLEDQLLARNVLVQPASSGDDGSALDPGRSGGHVGLITSSSSVAYSLVEVFPLLRSAAGTAVRAVTSAAGDIAANPDVPPSVTGATETPTAAATATETPSETPSETPIQRATKVPTAAIMETVTQTPTKTPTPMQAAPLAVTGQATRAETPQAERRATTEPAQQKGVVEGSSAQWSGVLRGNLRTAGWQPLAGEWRFSNDSLVQSDVNGYDMAIAYARDAFQNYSLEATLRHRDGNGAGVLFNLPSPDRLDGGHMVRYSDTRPGGIFWGYYDDSGKFVGQGYANVDPPGDTSHTLRVLSREETYDVYLDGFLLAADVPLQHPAGYIGLVTVQTSAAFDSVEVGGLAEQPTVRQTPASVQPLAAPGVYSGTLGLPSRAVVSGKWVVEGGVYQQTVPDPADYILNTGVYATDYTIESDILLANKPEIGGGFLLQAPERGRKAGATVVRFTSGGDGIFWGVYDEAGAFRGRASVDLPDKPEGETGYRLRVDVRGDRMDVLVDGEIVFADALLPGAEGWLGLTAFGGPVTFDNVQIIVRETGATP